MTTLTKNKTITFEAAVKICSKFVSTKSTRPEIEFIYHDSKGNLYATDSYRLLRINTTYITDLPKNEPFLYDPKVNKFVEGLIYPEVNRLIPNHYNTLIKIDSNIKDIEAVAKELKKIVSKEKNSPITFNFTNTETNIYGVVTEDKRHKEVCHDTINSVQVNEGEDAKVTVNVKYLLDVITAMKKLTKLSNEDIELKLIGRMRPIVFSQSNIFDILLMPIRLY